jgi:hypothetical protein
VTANESLRIIPPELQRPIHGKQLADIAIDQVGRCWYIASVAIPSTHVSYQGIADIDAGFSNENGEYRVRLGTTRAFHGGKIGEGTPLSSRTAPIPAESPGRCTHGGPANGSSTAHALVASTEPARARE